MAGSLVAEGCWGTLAGSLLGYERTPRRINDCQEVGYSFSDETVVLTKAAFILPTYTANLCLGCMTCPRNKGRYR